MNNNILSLSIDLGAKNTGVFSAYYKENSLLKDIKKKGFVYNLDKDKYTLLLNNRTASRHQRRILDRKQMVKRLFKLIWKNELKIDWNLDIEKSASFLLNRRGFSFLTEEYNVKELKKFPKRCLEYLKLNDLGIDVSKYHNPKYGKDNYNLYDLLIDLQKESKITNLFDHLSRNYKNSLEKKEYKKTLENISKYKKSSDKKLNVKKSVIEQIINSGYNIFKDSFSEKYMDKKKNGELNPYKILLHKFLYDNEGNLGDIKSEINNYNLNKSEEIWSNIKIDSFSLEKINFGKDDVDVVKHFFYALSQINSEIINGSRHRSKYFKEIKEILKNKNHTHNYLKNFVEIASHNNLINNNKLFNLIGNISNLELKPLRKYFNDKQHQESDYWDITRFKKFYLNWILQEWRVGEEDKDKNNDNSKYSYKELCDEIKSLKDDGDFNIISYLQFKDPNWTIPPYQDNNNRKPPKCQSLLLNTNYLDKKYPDWQIFLEKISQIEEVSRYLGNYIEDLKNAKSGKGKSYFSKQKSENFKISSGQRSLKEVKTRQLQFIFDRSKSSDELKLNHIYSLAKKIRQNINNNNEEIKKYRSDLELVIRESKLTEDLKERPNYSTNDIFSEGSFLHLICKYYKLRQRARDGRLFIMPEFRYDSKKESYINTGRFDDKDHLLSYCNHKPRQKRYQLISDLAAILQVAPDILKEKLGDTEDKVMKSLMAISGLKSNSEKAVKEQKEYKNNLNDEISKAKSEIKKNKEENKIKYKHPLCKLIEEIEKLSKELSEKIGNKELYQKFNSIYSFAQINQVAFTDRAGNSKICAICSIDNANRMNIENNYSKAQRLPAISTRVIDGAVKKMANIIANQIVRDNWDEVKSSLENNYKITIPIIIESNNFEFEPSLRKLKGKSEPEDVKDLRENNYNDKSKRIVDLSSNICAYSGENMSNNNIEYDHIIPRSSKKYGTLNDEANLIAVTRSSNQERGNKRYYLKDLNQSYKNKIFENKNDQEIKKFIYDEIWDEENKSFKFGRYKNFVNLTKEERIAFKHSLFLEDNDILRNEVVKAINNINRALVNGTQRYVAEVIANKFYLAAKKENLDVKKLSFDFFNIESSPNRRGDSIYDLRKSYENLYPDIEKYTKGGKSQENYSHLIDAMIAFTVAANNHKKEGSMKLNIDDNCALFPYDPNTGEVSDNNIFNEVKINNNDFEIVSLEKRSRLEYETHIREKLMQEYINSKENGIEIDLKEYYQNQENSHFHKIPYKIHNDSIKRERFVPLLKIKDCKKESDKWKIGFSIDNCDNLKIDPKIEEKLLQFFIHNKETKNYDLFIVNKTKTQDFLINLYNSDQLDKESKKISEILEKFSYFTIRKPIKSLKDAKNLKDLSDCIKYLEDNISKLSEKKIDNSSKNKIKLPIYNEWQKLLQEMKDYHDPNENIDNFLKESKYFNHQNDKKEKLDHQKTSKSYVIPSLFESSSSIRIKRKSWNGENIYQITSEEKMPNYGDSRPLTISSKNQSPNKTRNPHNWKDLELIKLKWVEIALSKEDNITEDLDEYDIKKLYIKYQSNKHSKIKIIFKKLGNLPFTDDNYNLEIKAIFKKNGNNEIKDNKIEINQDKWFKNDNLKLASEEKELILNKKDNLYEMEYFVNFKDTKRSNHRKWLYNQ
jgi:CRISPR system subtype II-B RNA-guided endonuclease Cas9/Csx12